MRLLIDNTNNTVRLIHIMATQVSSNYEDMVPVAQRLGQIVEVDLTPEDLEIYREAYTIVIQVQTEIKRAMYKQKSRGSSF